MARYLISFPSSAMNHVSSLGSRNTLTDHCMNCAIAPSTTALISGLPVSARVDSPGQAAELASLHWALDGGGIVLAQPLPEEVALAPAELAGAMAAAGRLANGAGPAAIRNRFQGR